nr:gamma-glutamylcyclotransferase family protein [uncultured Hyphomonas sp.]
MSILYFAYGSNMLTERLRGRCPSAKPLGVAKAADRDLVFHKRSKKDGSGKATLTPGSGEAFGVLFELDPAEQPALDRAEGKGYGYERDDSFNVVLTATGKTVRAQTYLATANAMDTSLKPLDWYRAFVLAGATQHGLPAAWVDVIEKTGFDADTRTDQTDRDEAKAILSAAGFAHLLK